MASDVTPSGKKKYSPPQVIDHGDVRTMTRNLGPKGANDGGGGAAAGPKTS